MPLNNHAEFFAFFKNKFVSLLKDTNKITLINSPALQGSMQGAEPKTKRVGTINNKKYDKQFSK